MRISRLIVVLAVLTPFAALFGRALLWGDVLGYRDAANFYLPTFEWELEEWRAGRVPLWNPHDNLGTPFLADASSSVFYPGKLVFALPLDYVRRFNLYTSLHVLLAAATSYWLARRLHLGVEASGFAAVAYAFGANVVFQYANVIFLVGAAWLPLAFLAAHQMLQQRSPRWAVGLGCVLALMTLGGDPQAAYHVVLLTAIYALLTSRAEKKAASASLGVRHSPDWKTCAGMCRRRPILVAIACLGGFGMAAIQILPSMEWTRHSDRAAFQTPRSVFEVVSFAGEIRQGTRAAPPDGPAAVIRRGIFGRPARGTHHEHVYEFSVGPWRLAEFLWPNCMGRSFPTNRRWISMLPAEGRAWIPSLYLGLLPLVFALAGWRVRRTIPVVQWLSCCTVLAVLASLGWYGIGWLVHELRVGTMGAQTDDVLLGQPVGGLYWMMVCLLPGYAYFRYPAKWLVVASLGVSLLAARSLHRGGFRRSPALPRVFAVISALSLLGSLLIAVSARYLASSVTHPPVDAVFGPLDVLGGCWDASRSLLHTGLVSLLAFLVFRAGSQVPKRRCRQFALVLTSLELTVAHGWLTETVSREVVQSVPAAVQAIQSHQHIDPNGGGSRVFRASPFGWFPRKWSQESDTRRLDDVVQWERDTLLPKHHLPAGVSLVESFSSLASSDYRSMLRVARRHGPQRAVGNREPYWGVLNALSARHLVVPAVAHSINWWPASIRSIQEVESDRANMRPVGGATVYINPRAFPRAWIVHYVDRLSPLTSTDPAMLEKRAEDVFFPDGEPRRLMRSAVVECNELDLMPEGPAAAGELCRIEEYGPQEVVCDVVLKTPGALLLNDLFYPGWVAHRRNPATGHEEPLEVVRANRVMRATMLPAGRHQVRFRYRPPRVYVGAALSGLAWLISLAFLSRIRSGVRCRTLPECLRGSANAGTRS